MKKAFTTLVRMNAATCAVAGHAFDADNKRDQKAVADTINNRLAKQG